ncbi:HlyD family efflux transporter periplasmic adaptor subunit [Blastopirellula sp. JC732]|uniref:HlyD family efflux transporter periplasmic adaptor subunit n=1 Tax=Blastopirellula sediminis TaxID=2894196 RepID=A0A9X1MRN7_9BACT|nr:HlyD family efflux transporter periplasmic adaptor subunit [Blastopirellula sediminis]MCC9606338.1 HlyD family efflux transporter periplasmic adaptor subunit [Blastopirellula sediminis]MCC9630364.1 HlyD family efflux transporter periplasmic adaptor subunit [Blastopirellula sediminis]
MSEAFENSSPESRPNLHLDTPRRSWFWPILFLLIIAGIGFGAYYLPSSGLLSVDDEATGALTYEVQREQLLVTVTDDGNVESASNIDVKCDVAGGGTILWIVEDGKRVTKGEEIIRIDTSAIEDQLNAQKIVYEKALATKIETQEAYEAAKLAVQEYAEGTFLQTLQQLEASIKIAQQNLTTAEDMLGYSKRMSRKGYVTSLQREADAYAVERAKLDLEVAETSKRVLVDFTKQKTIRELEAARDSAEARMRSEEAAFQLEKARLDRLQKQLANCVIKAPQNGMVVYANESDRRGGSQDTGIAEGTIVREGQTIVRIPDLAKMQVKVTIHESKIDRIRSGMPARIVIQDRTFAGHVTSIANQPEPTGWFSANVKEYATIASIDGTQEGLRPGLTAFVEIQVADIRDALTVPVSAVVEQRGKYFCWVKATLGPERRPLKLGHTNDKLIEVLDGVKEGDLVLRNPRAVVADARMYAEETPAEPGEEEASEEKEAEGQASPSDRPTSGGPTAGPPGGGPGGGAPRLDPFANDADKDGKLSKDEAPEQMKNYFDRIDKDGDGFITRAEMAASRAARERSQQGGGPPGGGGPSGSGGGPPRP